MRLTRTVIIRATATMLIYGHLKQEDATNTSDAASGAVTIALSMRNNNRLKTNARHSTGTHPKGPTPTVKTTSPEHGLRLPRSIVLRMVNVKLAHPNVRHVPTCQANEHEPPTTSTHPNAMPTLRATIVHQGGLRPERDPSYEEIVLRQRYVDTTTCGRRGRQ